MSVINAYYQMSQAAEDLNFSGRGIDASGGIMNLKVGGQMRPFLYASLVLGLAGLSQRAAARSDVSQLLAAKLTQEYGPADSVVSDRLIWTDKGPWKRITLWRVGPASEMGSQVLEQTVSYPVLPERARLLGEFSPDVKVSDDGAALSARGPSEELNSLTLNLAQQVVAGRLSPEQARALYKKTVRLQASGKNSPMLQGIQFSPRPPQNPGPPIRVMFTPGSNIMNPLWDASGT
jgi:hypothetical protein